MMIRSMSTTEPSIRTSSGSGRNSGRSMTPSTPSRLSTALDTGTTKPEAHAPERQSEFVFSRIGGIIFLANFLGLFILVLGALLLSEWSAGLTQAQVRSLRVQGD